MLVCPKEHRVEIDDNHLFLDVFFIFTSEDEHDPCTSSSSPLSSFLPLQAREDPPTLGFLKVHRGQLLAVLLSPLVFLEPEFESE